ncbi:hypothetical protein S40293_11152 [Stachybotrys chartarum IBT 40293]|nr:hypothetical protein S40293_11152 [Stachybotrys chartarum IBT 40293]
MLAVIRRAPAGVRMAPHLTNRHDPRPMRSVQTPPSPCFLFLPCSLLARSIFGFAAGRPAPECWLRTLDSVLCGGFSRPRCFADRGWLGCEVSICGAWTDPCPRIMHVSLDVAALPHDLDLLPHVTRPHHDRVSTSPPLPSLSCPDAHRSATTRIDVPLDVFSQAMTHVPLV